MILISFVVSLIAAVGSLVAGLGSQACFMILFDEPECPNTLIK